MDNLDNLFVDADALNVPHGSGAVVSAIRKSDGSSCVLKVIRVGPDPSSAGAAGSGASQARVEYSKTLADNEATIASSMIHPFIVPTLGTLSRNGLVLIAMKQLTGSVAVTAAMVASQRVRHTFDILPQIVFALEYMHALGISHGGIQPDSVLVTTSGDFALSNFRLARRLTPVAGEFLPQGETRTSCCCCECNPLRFAPVHRRGDVYVTRVHSGTHGGIACCRP